jgi:hypothetical protein
VQPQSPIKHARLAVLGAASGRLVAQRRRSKGAVCGVTTVDHADHNAATASSNDAIDSVVCRYSSDASSAVGVRTLCRGSHGVSAARKSPNEHAAADATGVRLHRQPLRRRQRVVNAVEGVGARSAVGIVVAGSQ